jgi:Tol biopolymer transport system component
LIRLRWAALASVLGIFVLLAGCGSNTQPFNDTPVIMNLFPSSAAAGGPGFTLSVAGNGFIAQSVLYWNNIALTTTFDTTTLQLSAPIPASDIAAAGVAQVSVVTPSPGGGTSNAATFTINAAQNPVPTISALSPASTPMGVLPPNNVLLVNGTNFVQSVSAAAFNGVARPTNFVNATQLSVPMSPSDVAANTTINVTVVNSAPGGGVSSSLPFKVGTGGSVRLKATVAASTQFPEVVSSAALGGVANAQSSSPAMSADGRFVAFYSQASNLVAQGAWGNVFVRDTCLGAANCSPQTIAVDLAPDGSAPNGPAGTQVAISGDGRFASFASSATNLVPSTVVAPASGADVYVRDLCIGANAPAGCISQTQLVSATTDGNGGAGVSNSPSMSFDGRFIAFVSSASDLVSDGSSGGSGVFVRDTCASLSATNLCVAKTYSATSSVSPSRGGDFSEPVISADGRYTAFVLGNASAPTVSQVLLADMCLGPDATTSCQLSVAKVSVSADGSDFAGVNQSPSISADGRFVVFESRTPGAAPNVLLRDTCLGASAPAPCVPSTALLAENASAPLISSAGRYVSYVALAAAISGTDGASAGSLYVYDTCFGAAAGCSPQPYPVNGASAVSSASPFTANAAYSAPMSSHGSFIAFSTSSAAVANLPLSGQGDVLLSITPF